MASDSIYASKIVDIVDYPKPGVVFKDLTPIFSDWFALKEVVFDLSQEFSNLQPTKIMAAEARGFLIGSPLAFCKSAGFVPARKPGKLPREVYEVEYSLEYGTDKLCVHKDALNSDDRVLIIDDLLATGGTAAAMSEIVSEAGAEVLGFGFIVELAFLNPREEIYKVSGAPVKSLIVVD